MKVIIYTDGACKGNPGVGGWGAVLQWGDNVRELCGGEVHTTNNRMELLAAIQALSALRRACDVVLYTDSDYVKKGITEWLPQWQKNAGAAGGLVRMEGRKKRAVKNEDLWLALLAATKLHRIEWQWLRGHSGHAGNERADALANRGVEKMLVQKSADALDVEEQGALRAVNEPPFL